MGKSWMKPRRDSRQMISPEYHLIVSEGINTEPKYFERIKEIIDIRFRDRIHLDISGKGANTVSLFNRALKDVARSNNVYKHVWLVYDNLLICQYLINRFNIFHNTTPFKTGRSSGRNNPCHCFEVNVDR